MMIMIVPNGEELTMQCAWCNKIMSGPFKGTKPDYVLPEASHGICTPCEEETWKVHAVKRIKRIAQLTH